MLVECSVSQDQRKEGFSSISIVVVYGLVWFDGLTLFSVTSVVEFCGRESTGA